MGMNVSMDEGGGEDGGGNESIVAEINITPLTDVFLVLLIIFMVTTTVVVDADKSTRDGMKVALPKSNATGPASKRKTDPIVTLKKTNELYVNTKQVTAASLEAELRTALTAVGSDTVLIRGDTNVLLGSAISIMSTAKKAGATSIQILTAPEAK